jgi:hypothetical protein
VEFSQALAFNTLRKDGCFPLVSPPLGEISRFYILGNGLTWSAGTTASPPVAGETQ